jgi:hypothetical protein
MTSNDFSGDSLWHHGSMAAGNTMAWCHEHLLWASPFGSHRDAVDMTSPKENE